MARRGADRLLHRAMPDLRRSQRPGYCPMPAADRGDGKALIPIRSRRGDPLAFQWYSSGEWSDRTLPPAQPGLLRDVGRQTVPFRTKFYGRRAAVPGRPVREGHDQGHPDRPFTPAWSSTTGWTPDGEAAELALIVRHGKHQPLVSLELFQHCRTCAAAGARRSTAR